MDPRLLARFLLGRSDAIRALAGNRYTLPVGLLLCLSAGLARSYDSAYLAVDPAALLRPAWISLAIAVAMHAAIFLACSARARRWLPNAGASFVSIAGLYWLTAPLAWLHGIPFERFLDERNAGAASFAAVVLTGVWRVALLSRVYAVCLPWTFGRALVHVATLALPIVYAAAVVFRPRFGGIFDSIGMSLLVFAAFLAGLLAFVLGAGYTILGLFFGRCSFSMEAFAPQQATPPTRATLGLCLGALALFAAPLAWTQPEQRRRVEIERLYPAGDLPRFLTTLASHPRAEYPPHWTPPPWPEDGRQDLRLLEVLAEIERRPDLPPWIRAVYRRKARAFLDHADSSLPTEIQRQLESFAAKSH